MTDPRSPRASARRSARGLARIGAPRAVAAARSASPARRAPPGGSRTGSARKGGTPARRFGLVHLVDAIAAYAKSARCANDLDRMVVLERMRQEFDSEPATLLRRGFDKAYRQVMEGV